MVIMGDVPEGRAVDSPKDCEIRKTREERRSWFNSTPRVGLLGALIRARR